MISHLVYIHIGKNLPDCLLIDIIMPNNEGYDFIKNLKKNKNFQHIPFILLTAKGLTEDRILGYKLGCSAYISKPFDPEELESIIKNIVLKNDIFLESILENYVLLKEIKNPSVYIQELAGRVEPSFAFRRFVELSDTYEVMEESNVEVKEESLILN